ncbi:hypothetical protein BM1_05692 [Bipolaris maydis]|nr:hypothetical protein BM1_05692 [Bipolaris maydis]
MPSSRRPDKGRAGQGKTGHARPSLGGGIPKVQRVDDRTKYNGQTLGFGDTAMLDASTPSCGGGQACDEMGSEMQGGRRRDSRSRFPGGVRHRWRRKRSQRPRNVSTVVAKSDPNLPPSKRMVSREPWWRRIAVSTMIQAARKTRLLPSCAALRRGG